MNAPAFLRPSMHLLVRLLFGGCAVSGPSYEDVMANAVPNVYGSAGAAIATGTAGMVAGDVAGTASAIALESKGKRCRGPHKLERISEEDALPRLKDLTCSKE
jgi:hypothetical protein